MTGRRFAIGISGFFALALCCFAATGASAAQHAWLCAHEGTGFSDAHCTRTVGGGYSHKEITEFESLTITGTNEATTKETEVAAPLKIKGKLAGLEAEVQCNKVIAEGTLGNHNSLGTPFASGVLTMEFSKCSVIKPAMKNCEVGAEFITTKILSWDTFSTEEPLVKIQPGAGQATEFFAIPIKNCSNAALNHEWSAFGYFIVRTTGATWSITHGSATAQGTLKWDGNLAGVEGSLTVRKKEGDPIAFT